MLVGTLLTEDTYKTSYRFYEEYFFSASYEVRLFTLSELFDRGCRVCGHPSSCRGGDCIVITPSKFPQLAPEIRYRDPRPKVGTDLSCNYHEFQGVLLLNFTEKV